MPEYTQDNRPLRVDTPLPNDTLLLNGFNGVEAISHLFTYTLDLASPKQDVDAAELVGKPMLLSWELPAGEKRYVNGLVSRLAYLGQSDDLTFYRAEIVPWLWRLTLTSESRMYQDLTVPDILEKVFERTDSADYELRLSRTYDPREYCVQYRETHFNFVSRLMEEEGIWYFFEHTDEKHTLVLCDDNNSTDPALEAEIVRFLPEHKQIGDAVHEFEGESSLHTGKVTLWNYDYLQPTLKLRASLGEALESYTYPAPYTDPEKGEKIARNMLEAEEATRRVVRGESTLHGLLPAHFFTMKGHYRDDANDKYLLTQVQHYARCGGYRAWDTNAEFDYRNEFQAIPFDTPYRAPRKTPRPTIRGWQSAIVTGPPGEEIHTDKYARVKVQFYWDRDGKKDENSSCWIRVVTPWGGKGYGSVSIPRIGNEVVVAFAEGDPDYPLVIGSLYNDDQQPPYALPNAGITMGMKSRTSPGGGGQNEITMNDTKGKELMNIHAQYDMVTKVEHDQTNSVVNNRTTNVDVDDKEDIGSNQTMSVGADQKLSVGANQTISVGGNQEVTVDGNQKTTISGNETITVSGNQKVGIDGDQSVDVGGSDTISIGGAQTIDVGGAYKLTISGAGTIASTGNLKLGSDADVVIDGGANVKVTGAMKITLSASGSTIEIGPSGIKIQSAALVTVQGATIKLN
jgi:type VI secretion system secreted protein VgrG